MSDKKKEFAQRAAELVTSAYRFGWMDGIKRMEGVFPANPDKITPMGLLERFVDLYGETPLAGAMIEPGRKLWRDYYEFMGEHMILTDEGWEPGEVKQSYLDEIGPDAILDEVNAATMIDAELAKKG